MEYFKKSNELGVTIVLTTHYMEEAEFLCNHIAVINKGTIIANEKKSLLSKTNQKVILITITNDEITEKDENCLKISLML